MLLATSTVYATEKEIKSNPITNVGVTTTSQSVAGAMALSGSTSFSGGGSALTGASNANNSVNVDNGNDRIIPVSSAIAPSQSVNNDCQIATPQSKAVSLLIFGFSGTTGVTYNDVCYAYKRGQFDISDKLMCLKSKDYAKVNPSCK